MIKQAQPIGITTLPLIQSFRLLQNPSVFINDNLQRYGDFYKLSIPTRNIYIAANPEVLQHVLVRNEANYIKSKIYWGELKKMIGAALGTLEGDEWLKLRQLQLKAFSHATVHSHLQQTLDYTIERFKEWEGTAEPLDVIHRFSSLNISVLLKLLFGYNNSSVCDKAASMITDGEDIISYRSKYPWRPYVAAINGRNSRYKRHLKFFDKLADDVIENRSRNKERERLIDLLLEKSTDKAQIRNEIIVHLGAGSETAAIAMGWTLFALSQHPEALKKLEDEIDRVIGKESVQPQHYDKLRFTDGVVKETLRLYPPSYGIVRDAAGNDNYNGLSIKKGDTFFISAYGLHRNPRLWEQPQSFMPERFLTEPPKYSYIPYGAGRHTCIGRYVAQPTLVLTLAAFIQRFAFDLKLAKPVIPQSMATLKPNQPFRITLKRKMI